MLITLHVCARCEEEGIKEPASILQQSIDHRLYVNKTKTIRMPAICKKHQEVIHREIVEIRSNTILHHNKMLKQSPPLIFPCTPRGIDPPSFLKDKP